jgi:DNA (cytosine-5)-methyltransferase 1
MRPSGPRKAGKTVRILSLFAGIGGFDLGLERAGMQCVGQVEINPFCQRVLAYHWPHVKRIGDIHDVNGTEFEKPDVVCGGVPCQPASTAGKRRGVRDDRWLWPEAFRVVKLYSPAWVLFENVRGLTSLENGMVIDSLLSELESYGYEMLPPIIIPACAVDAKHRRDRVWLVGHSEHDGLFAPEIGSGPTKRNQGSTEPVQAEQPSGSGFKHALVANPNVAGLEREITAWIESGKQGLFAKRSRWPTESGICRVSNGVPGRVDRLRGLGNAVVPQVVEVIGRAIIKSSLLKG